MNLHGQIMNLTCVIPGKFPLNEHMAYKVGHRDARHAAAELAISADAESAERTERAKVLARWIQSALLTLETIDPDEQEDGGDALRLMMRGGQSLVQAVLGRAHDSAPARIEP